jgi:hypothetical protein
MGGAATAVTQQDSSVWCNVYISIANDGNVMYIYRAHTDKKPIAVVDLHACCVSYGADATANPLFRSVVGKKADLSVLAENKSTNIVLIAVDTIRWGESFVLLNFHARFDEWSQVFKALCRDLYQIPPSMLPLKPEIMLADVTHLIKVLPSLTPVHVQTYCRTRFLSWSAPFLLTDELGWSLVHYAVFTKEVPKLNAILDSGGRDAVNVPSPKDGQTPLHLAARMDLLAMAQSLVGAGAQLRVADAAGYVPVQYAVSPRMREILNSPGIFVPPSTTPPAPQPSASDPASPTSVDAREPQYTYSPYGAPPVPPPSAPPPVIDNECRVCFTNAIETALIPCGHSCLCMTCAARCVSCPICRQRVQQVLKIYHS